MQSCPVASAIRQMDPASALRQTCLALHVENLISEEEEEEEEATPELSRHSRFASSKDLGLK